MGEATINGVAYRIGKLNALQQLHVGRRVLGVLANGAQGSQQLLGAISAMPDEQVDYVVNRCLAVVQRCTGTPGAVGASWAPVMGSAGIMFQDMDAAALLQLTVEVVKENLMGFFTAVSVVGAESLTLPEGTSS